MEKGADLRARHVRQRLADRGGSCAVHRLSGYSWLMICRSMWKLARKRALTTSHFGGSPFSHVFHITSMVQRTLMPWLLIAPLCRWKLVPKRRSWWCRLYLHQLWASHAMATLLSRWPPSNTWDLISINQAPLRTLSHKSERGLVVLGCLFSGVICCNVTIPSTCICICCKYCSACLTIWVPDLGYAHSPRAAVANDARAALRLYDYYLRTICPLLPSTPRKLLLTELGLLPLQVFWWRQTLRFWDSLAVLPVGSLYRTVCLDSLTDAFQGGACNMASSLFAFRGF